MKFGHKYRAKPVDDNGDKFPSTLEWKYFKFLKGLQELGDVVFFLRQVPFHFPGGKYICDFQVFYKDGLCEFIDVKGVITSEFSLKKRIVEETYPVEIKIIKKGDF